MELFVSAKTKSGFETALSNGTVWIILVACLIFPAWVEISPVYF